MAEVLFITPSLRGVISDNFLGTILLTTILKNNGVKADILGFHDFGNLDDFDSFIELDWICCRDNHYCPIYRV